MATRSNSKLSPKNAASVKAMPARGQRTATHANTISAAPSLYKQTPQQKAQEKKWQAEGDLRTLRDAAAIKADSGRVKAAQAEAQAQIKALSTVVKK